MPSRKKRKRMRRKGKSPSKKKGKKKEKKKKEKKSEKKDKDLKGIKGFYERNYKPLMIIPFLILVASLAIIGTKFATTGDFIDKDVSLQGGLSITVLNERDVDSGALEKELSEEFPQSSIRARGIAELGDPKGVNIEASDVEREELINALSQKLENFEGNYSVENIGPALGQSFLQQTAKALWIAFIFMGMVVFLYFGEQITTKVAAVILTIIASFLIWNSAVTFNLILSIAITIGLLSMYVIYSIPSAAVVLAALSDIIATLAVMNVMNIRLSTAGIAALLMLIGYSVDTDILLSTRVLKRKKGRLMDRMFSAIKTGLTINATTLASVTVALIVSQSDTISSIMTILLIGLIIDIINTWIQNAGILRYYIEKRGLE